MDGWMGVQKDRETVGWMVMRADQR